MATKIDNRKVSPEVAEKIISLLRAGMSQDAIAASLKDEGISIYTIRTVIRNNHLQRESWRVRKEQKFQQILALYAEGCSYDEIKNIAQVELSTIHKALQTQHLFYTKEQMKERVLELFLAGIPTTVIAKELRISYKRICNILRDAGYSPDTNLYARTKVSDTSQSKENVLRQYQSGKTAEEISELTGLSIYQIKRDIALA